MTQAREGICRGWIKLRVTAPSWQAILAKHSASPVAYTPLPRTGLFIKLKFIHPVQYQISDCWRFNVPLQNDLENPVSLTFSTYGNANHLPKCPVYSL